MVDLARVERALVIAPHADDEALGCGGLIARLVDGGAEIRVLFIAVDGFHHYGHDGRTTFEQRVAEIEAAAGILGYGWEIVYGDEDLIEKLDTVPKRDLVDRFETETDQLRPDLVLIPSGADYDQDHVATFDMALAALRPISPLFDKWLVPHVLVYESPKVMWWHRDVPRPQAFVDIGDVLDRKLAALAAYATQARPSPHIRSPENVTALARLRGAEIGVEHAEAFQTLRTVLS